MARAGTCVGRPLAVALVVLLTFTGLLPEVEAHEEHDAHHWRHQAHELLFEKKDYTMQKINIAKNIMVFVGSGMSQATVTAARFYNGGDNETFSFERLKWSGNALTYCVDSRVPDPACAGTALLTGVKSNIGTVAMDPTVRRGACELDPAKKLASIAKWALDAGKAIGFATTSRVTTGSNAALYANSPDSRWENDADVREGGCDPATVPDIAHQLIHGDIGKHFKVILGGGRKNFLPTTETDPGTGGRGLRTDGKNLITEWRTSKPTGANATYITTTSELGSLDTSKVDFLLGLFDFDHLPFSVDIGAGSETPPLVRLVHYALEMLQKREHRDGFLLFVEDGNIRRAHQQNKVRKALDQVRHFGSAFGMAQMMSSELDTLLVALNDVGSTLSLPGYQARSTDPVSEPAGTSDADALPYLGLAYATGPAHSTFYRAGPGRLDPADVLQATPDPAERTCPATVPLAVGADGGEDATVHASGPWGYLLSGGYEQHFVAHQIAFASCMDGACGGAAGLRALPVGSVALALAATVARRIFRG